MESMQRVDGGVVITSVLTHASTKAYLAGKIAAIQEQKLLWVIYSKFKLKMQRKCPSSDVQMPMNLDKTTATKHPKSKFYGGSESFGLRMAATIS